MKNCKPLKDITQRLIPEYYGQIGWGNLWRSKPESGTAFEWTVLAALIYACKENHISVEMPLLEKYHAGDYFLLRNDIPSTYGSQAGNSAAVLSSKPLKYRFLYSLVPKAIFKTGGKSYSVFREGCPYHKIMCGQFYSERTDIVIIPGAPTEDFLKLNSLETQIQYSFLYEKELLEGILRIGNSPFIPCKSRSPKKDIRLPATGIVECSVNKTAEKATNQLLKYDSLFSNGEIHPALSLVTGNDLSCLDFDTHQIHLDSDDTDLLFHELLAAAEGILKNFAIID